MTVITNSINKHFNGSNFIVGEIDLHIYLPIQLDKVCKKKKEEEEEIPALTKSTHIFDFTLFWIHNYSEILRPF